MGGASSTSVRLNEGPVAHLTDVNRAVLMADCGSAYTKVALLGMVEGRFRLLASVQTATTSVPPVADVVAGMRDAIQHIERITGRTLLQNGALVVPRRDDGSGVDGFALATSAGGPLRLLASGPGRDALAGLLHRSLGGLFVQLDALPATPAAVESAPEWQQLVAQVRDTHPHAVLVVGSPFGVARSATTIEETTSAVAAWLDALRDAPAPSGGTVGRPLPVVFTGSGEDAALLQNTLQRHDAIMQAVEALSPSTLAPLNRAIGSLYETEVLQRLPGYPGLRRMTSAAPAATITALAGLVRYLAQHFQTSVVGVDIGAASTALVGAASQGDYFPAAHPGAGVGSGAGTILRSVGAPGVLRWMSEPATEDDLREYVLTRMLRPRALPATSRELEFEHALAREAIQLALRAPGSRLAGMTAMDVLLGTGGVLANVPHPAMAALILLDALQPRGIASLVLDTAHLSNVLGTVAGIDQQAAAEVAESDAVLLQLGTVISTLGALPDGEPAVRVVLEYGDGRKHVEDVAQGRIVRLPLPQGERALLGLFPSPMIDVGLGPGQHARASEPVEGGALGLVVDARGRPLILPQAAEQRMARIGEWRRALALEV